MKSIKKTILFAFLLMTLVMVIPTQASAAAKINKKSVTLIKGQTVTLKITGTKNKVKWSSNKKSVATVNSKGKVTAKKKGTAQITAKVGKKKYVCKVTVKAAKKFDKKEAVKKLTYTIKKIEGGRILFIKNNYEYNIQLFIECLYYDSNKVLIAKRDDMVCPFFESGKQCIIANWDPFSSSGESIKYSSYKLIFTVEEVFAVGNSEKLSCKGNFGADNVMVTVKNSDSVVSVSDIVIIFYKNGKIIGCDSAFTGTEPNSESYIQFNLPYDKNYNTIHPDNFKLFVNYSYKYPEGR